MRDCLEISLFAENASLLFTRQAERFLRVKLFAGVVEDISLSLRERSSFESIKGLSV